MTAHNMFLSWANWVKGKLQDDGVSVNVEMYREKTLVTPYLFLEDGPEIPMEKGWVSGMFVQARLVVEKIAGEKIEVTAGRLLDKIITSLRDPGLLPKLDYSGNTATSTDKYITVIEASGSPELSGDPNRSEKVLRFELYSNNKM